MVDPADPQPRPEQARRRRARRGVGVSLLDLLFGAGRRVLAELATLRIDLAHLAKVRKDKVQVRARSLAFGLALGVVATIFGVVVLAAAAWSLIEGLAGALAALFEAPQWLGSLIVGLALPLLLLGGIALVGRRAQKRQLEELLAEYAELERLRSEAHASHCAAGPEETTP